MKRLLTLLLPMMAAMAVSAQTNVVVINDVELSNGEAIVSIPLRNTTPLREVEAKFRVFTDELGFETDAAGNPVLYINSDRANGHTYSVTTDEITINSRTAVDVEFTITSSNAFNGTNGEIAHFKLIDKGNWTNDYSDVKYAATGTDMDGQTMNLYTEGQSAIFKVTRPQQTGIAIDETNFPDPVFRAWVLANYNDGNGYLDQARAEACTGIEIQESRDCNEAAILNFQGIKFFPNLEAFLYDAYRLSHNSSQSQSFDFSGMSKLNFVRLVLKYDENAYTANTSVNVSGCTALTELEVWGNAHGTSFTPNPESYNNTVNITGCTTLKKLQIDMIPLSKTLDMTGFSALEDLRLACAGLRAVDASGLANLSYFSATSDVWLAINFENTPQLTSASMSSTYAGQPDGTYKIKPYKTTVNGQTKYYFYNNDETKGDHQSFGDIVNEIIGAEKFDNSRLVDFNEGGTIDNELGLIILNNVRPNNTNYCIYNYFTGNSSVSNMQGHLIFDIENAIEDNVNPFVKAVQSVDVAGISLPKGITSEIDLSILPDDATNKEIVWASSDDSIVSVDQNGVVTTNAIGTATITATAADEGGAAVALTVNVTAAQVTFDLNQDGEVTVGDVSLLYAKILGLVD